LQEIRSKTHRKMKLLSLFTISLKVNTKSNTTYIFLCLQLQNVSHIYTLYRSWSFPWNLDPCPLFWFLRSASLSSISFLRRLWTRVAFIYRFLLSFARSTAKDSTVIARHDSLRSCPLLHLWLFTYLIRKQGKYHVDFYTLPIHVTRDAILEICVCTVIVTWLRENHNKKIYLWSLPAFITRPLY